MFTSILDGTLSILDVLICTAVSLFCGGAVAFTACYGAKSNRPSQNMIICLIILPAVVQAVIMLVNGNVGTGIAVAGTFSLVRFRSAQGNARDIAVIFLSMAAGLATGVGYIGYAVLFTLLISAVIAVLSKTNVGGISVDSMMLKITIPEDLDYTGVFDDILDKYTSYSELTRIKTTNMGTLYELTYIIKEKRDISEKQMLDDIRCRNGNLTVLCGKISSGKDEL